MAGRQLLVREILKEQFITQKKASKLLEIYVTLVIQT
jgi:hypothetical protein